MVAMKIIALIVASSFVAISAWYPELCAMDIVQLGSELLCIREAATVWLNTDLDRLVRAYECTNDVCAFNKICADGNLTWSVDKFWREAEKCVKVFPFDQEYNDTLPRK
ncbi:antimicrobial peptide microplusin-like isoform X2 [Haemaphysalis longicornis]